MDLTSKIDDLCSQAKTIRNGDMQCPLCGSTYKRLKTHLRSCITKSENIPPQRKVVQMQSSTVSTEKYSISSDRVKPRDVTGSVSSSNDLSEQVEHFFDIAVDLDSQYKQCPICLGTYKRAGLKNHLRSCYDKHSPKEKVSLKLVNVNPLVKSEPNYLTGSVSSSNDLSEQVEHYFKIAVDLDSQYKQCPICSGTYKSAGLKNHLRSCYKKITPKEETGLKQVNHLVKNEPIDVTDSVSSSKDISEKIEHYFVIAENIGSQYKQCPICSETYKTAGLKNHLRSCYYKISPKEEASLKLVNVNPLVKTEPKDVTMVTGSMSSSTDLSEKIKNDFARAKDVDSEHKQCPICCNPFKKNGLKKHLRSCNNKNQEEDTPRNVPHKEETMREIIKNSRSEEAVSRIVDVDAFEAELTSRLSGTVLSRPDVQSKSKVMNDLLEDLLWYINDNCQEVNWKKITSGSYYEKLKITSLDEIDCMVVCQLDSSQIVEYIDSEKLFIKIKAVNSTSSALFNNFNIINKDEYISPKMFSSIFSSIVKQFLIDAGMKARGILMEKNDPLSPAITLKNRSGSLYIDIVPGIEIVGWPEVCANWKMPANLRTSDIKSVFHLVTKIHHSEIDKPADDCQMWRLSFSLAEKNIMLHLDEYDDRTKLTCRKDVLRLLKCDLAEVKSKLKGDFVYISSYMLKTVILHLTKYHHKQEQWLSSEMRRRYIEALLVVKKCLEKRFLEHYFVQHANLMKKSADETSRERREVEAVIKFIDQKFHF